MKLLLIPMLLLLSTMMITPAYAQSFSFAKPDFVFQIKNIIEDFRLAIASSADKVTLVKEFVADKQRVIENELQSGRNVPMEFEERRKQLIEKIESVKDIPIRQELESIGEMNRIRILYSEFDKCQNSCTIEQKQMFNDRVNSLVTWNTKCIGTFDIDNYEKSENSFDDLAQKCPDLKKFSKNHLKTFVNGEV